MTSAQIIFLLFCQPTLLPTLVPLLPNINLSDTHTHTYTKKNTRLFLKITDNIPCLCMWFHSDLDITYQSFGQ